LGLGSTKLFTQRAMQFTRLSEKV